jgi:hypothetical protein
VGRPLAVKNWAEFQHYKDRSPAWIKLHKRILDDRVFHSLPVASRALAPMLWLLASEYEGGILPFDLGEFAFRLRQTEKEIENALNPLIDKGFLILEQGASEPLAGCQQPAIPRREENIKKEKSIEELFELPSCLDHKTWEAYREMRVKNKKPMTDYARDIVIRKLVKWADAGYDVNAILENSITGNWTDVYEPKEKPRHASGIREIRADESFAARNAQ